MNNILYYFVSLDTLESFGSSVIKISKRIRSVFGFEQAEPASDPLALLLDLLLHEVETHGEQREAEREPERAEDQLLVRRPLVHVGAGHDVAEADRGERDEAEVGAGEVVPALPGGEQRRPGHDVCGNDHQADGDRHRHLRFAGHVTEHLQRQ